MLRPVKECTIVVSLRDVTKEPSPEKRWIMEEKDIQEKQENAEVVRLLKKQGRSDLVRNIVLLILTAAICLVAYFAISTMKQVTQNLNKVSAIVDSLQEDIEKLDFDKLSDTADNLYTVSGEIRSAVDGLKDFSETMKSFNPFGR